MTNCNNCNGWNNQTNRNYSSGCGCNKGWATTPIVVLTNTANTGYGCGCGTGYNTAGTSWSTGRCGCTGTAWTARRCGCGCD